LRSIGPVVLFLVAPPARVKIGVEIFFALVMDWHRVVLATFHAGEPRENLITRGGVNGVAPPDGDGGATPE